MTIRTIALAVVVISLLITPAFVQAAVVADGLIVKQPVNADKTQVKADAVVDTAKRPIVVEEEVMAAPAAIPAAVPAAVAAVAAAPAAPPAIPVVPAAVAPVESVVTASDKAKPEPIPEVNIGHKSSDNTGDELPASLTTGFYIIVAGGFVAAAYITFRAFRKFRIRSNRAARRYGTRGNHSRHELQPLPSAMDSDSDGDDQQTVVFDRQP